MNEASPSRSRAHRLRTLVEPAELAVRRNRRAVKAERRRDDPAHRAAAMRRRNAATRRCAAAMRRRNAATRRDVELFGTAHRRQTRERARALVAKILTCYLEPDHPRYDFGEMHDRLHREGFTIDPGKAARPATFRLANMGDVRPHEKRAFVSALKHRIEAMGLDPRYRS